MIQQNGFHRQLKVNKIGEEKMNAYRVNKNKDNPYVMINKNILKCSIMSAKAKGILVYILSLPDDWQIFENELVKHFSDGRESIKSGIKELIDLGYIVRGERFRDEKGYLKGYEYTVYEEVKIDNIHFENLEKRKKENKIKREKKLSKKSEKISKALKTEDSIQSGFSYVGFSYVGKPATNNIITGENNNCNNTDCPEGKIEQIIEHVESINTENNHNINKTEEFVFLQNENDSKFEANNKKSNTYTIKYLKEIYDYNNVICHYDSKIVDEVLTEILNSINSKKDMLKICGNKEHKTEVFESVDVFTGRVLKFNKNNIINIIKKITKEMKKHKIVHVDLLVRTLCINEKTSYIQDETKDNEQKELNTQKNYNQVPQETNYEQREYTKEYLESFYEPYWDKHQ